MNDDLKERLTDLAFEPKKHHMRYRSSFRNVIIFYIFIIIFVLIYTTIIGYKIQELAEPRTAAALIGSKVIVTPEYGRDLDPAAELLAESFMQILPMAFQYLGDSVRGEIDASANDLCTKVEEQYLPVLNNALSETIRLKNDGGNFEQRLLGDLKDRIDHTAFDEYLRTKFIYSLPYFHSYINRLRRKPVKELSRKEYVERDLLLCWLYLQDGERYKDTNHSAPLFEITSSMQSALEEAARENPVQKPPQE